MPIIADGCDISSGAVYYHLVKMERDGDIVRYWDLGQNNIGLPHSEDGDLRRRVYTLEKRLRDIAKMAVAE